MPKKTEHRSLDVAELSVKQRFKLAFVEGPLKSILKAIDPDLGYCVYIVNRSTGVEEVVTLDIDDHNAHIIDVTADDTPIKLLKNVIEDFDV